MKVETLIDIITSDLDDDEAGHMNVTWPRKQIRDWIIEGYNQTFNSRPDLFMETKIIKVSPCNVIQDTCDCTTIRRVLGQSDSKGRVLNTLRERGLEVSFQWTGKTCQRQRKGRFRLESYAIDTVTDTLYIYPEVPLGEDVYVLVQCAVAPGELDDSAEVNEECRAAVTQWVLWRAMSKDTEVSQMAAASAQSHYKAFFDLLGLSTAQQTIIHKRAES